MKGVISNYRMGRHTQTTNQFVVKVEGIDTQDKAKGLIGRDVTWTSGTGKAFVGKLTHTHGSKGALRARFERGLPGQAVGTEVSIGE
jgi:large subunit ribosomal protein L35Ae